MWPAGIADICAPARPPDVVVIVCSPLPIDLPQPQTHQPAPSPATPYTRASGAHERYPFPVPARAPQTAARCAPVRRTTVPPP